MEQECRCRCHFPGTVHERDSIRYFEVVERIEKHVGRSTMPESDVPIGFCRHLINEKPFDADQPRKEAGNSK